MMIKRKPKAMAEDLERLRGTIIALCEEREGIVNAGPSVAEIETRAKAEVESLRGYLLNRGYLSTHLSSDWQVGRLLDDWMRLSQRVNSVEEGHIISTPPSVTVLHLLAGLLPDQLTSLLVEIGKRHSTSSNAAMSSEQRVKRLAEIEKELPPLEAQEEIICRRLDDENNEITPRRDLAPAELLLAVDEDLKRAA